MPKTNLNDLLKISAELRGDIIKMCYQSRSAHLGSCLSCVDIISSIYWGNFNIDEENPFDPNRDRFIMSKGHAAMALYAALAKRNFFSSTLLSSYNQDGGMLAEHPPANILPGIEAATGSLGHGLPIGIGLALGAKIKNLKYKIIVLLSDGENNEGSVWEGAMFASSQNLSNICAIIDYNKWQATGRSNEILNLESLSKKWEAFGWQAIEINGHDIVEIQSELNKAFFGDKPTVLIAHTIKGKGVSFMEDDNNWHYRVPTEDEMQLAFKELGLS